MQLKFRVIDDEIYFDSAEESQEYAKKHPGTVVVRNNDVDKVPTNHIKKKQLLDITPNMILNHLNKHVISQDNAKKEIALSMYYHSLQSKYSSNKNITTSGPILMVGPTGSGKTFIVQKACECIDTIFMHVDTSSMVPEGIVGYSIGELGKDILKKANYDMHKASHCVVFFDEMDKLFQKSNGSEITSQLLRLIEGTKLKLSKDIVEKLLTESADELDTSNMQFILGGAFQWIYDKKEIQKQYSIYYLANQESKRNSEISLEDLYKEDIPKELLGRMSSIINLKKLSKDDYYQILKNSESSPLREFIQKIELHGDRVDISDETIKQVASMAERSGLGVRGIKQTLKKMFKDALFTAPDDGARTHNIILNH